MQIGSSNDSAAVKAQYATSKGLDIRIAFHEKYSTNHQGYGNWIVSNYEIPQGAKVLELGCGTGSSWLGHDDVLARCGKLVMTDLSDGMLEKAQENLGERDNVEYQNADIQSLAYADNSFDVIIANGMLYHVPDLMKALQEVRRVLKDGGVFYCSTLGENNFTDILATWFKLGGEEFHPNHNFTMQNGGEKLRCAFERVDALFYEDSLHVTEVEDLVEYLCSLASFKAVLNLPVQRMREILQEHVKDGAIDLQKDYGMFVCR
jgi:ubiquinone/menaquinone biosynthesis C-methylase UbiE